MTDWRAGLSQAAIARVDGVLAVPLHRFLGFEAVSVTDGRAEARFTVGEAAINNVGLLHGGALYSLLDATCYLALVARLEAGTTASTADIAFSMMRPVAAGAEVRLSAQVDRLGRRLAFLQGEARVDGALVAKAQATKAVVAAEAA